MLNVIFETDCETQTNGKTKFICYAFNDIMLFTPENSDQDDYISKCFLIHFGFTNLLELIENSYLNGNIFQLSSFTKNLLYSICCEAESEKEALEWVELITTNIEKKKNGLTQSDLKNNSSTRRSKLKNSLNLNCKEILKNEVERHLLVKESSDIKGSISFNIKEIATLDEKTKELIKNAPLIDDKLVQVETILDNLKKQTQEESKEIEITDKHYWLYLAKEINVNRLFN
jgi:hypothetical protein